MHRLRFMLKLLDKYKIMYTVSLVIIIISSLMAFGNQYIVKILVDDVLNGGQHQLLVSLLLGLLALTTVRSLLRFFSIYNFEVIGQKIQLNIRNQGYKKIMHLDFTYFDKHRTGDIMTQMTMDLDLVRHFYSYVLYTALENIVMFLGAISIMLSIVDWSFAVFLVLVVPMVVWGAIRLAKSVHPAWVRIRKMRSQLNTVVQENISANKVIKAFVREEFENQKMEEANSSFRKAQNASAKIWRKYLPWLSNVQGVFMLYNIVAGGILVINGHITVGELVMFNNMVWMITGPLGQAGWLTNDVSNCLASFEKIYELLQVEPEIKNDGKSGIKRLKGNFEFMNVSFGYENQHAVHNINFRVEKGQKVAIIGPTGSGKSTIINLLCRFYDVDKGVILVDGKEIRSVDTEVLRSNIAVAQQDVFLFSDSISENIAYGKTNATKEEIIAAAKAAHAHDFIMKMPEGYDTIVGERGVGLSGGQKQRLTLARALLKNPEVLILDDTTSALDSKTERGIQERLGEYFAEKTVFVISQRIASVKDCDQIIVLDRGKISEIGTHDELLENKKYYYSVYKHQYGSFEKFSEGGVLNA